MENRTIEVYKQMVPMLKDIMSKIDTSIKQNKDYENCSTENKLEQFELIKMHVLDLVNMIDEDMSSIVEDVIILIMKHSFDMLMTLPGYHDKINKYT